MRIFFLGGGKKSLNKISFFLFFKYKNRVKKKGKKKKKKKLKKVKKNELKLPADVSNEPFIHRNENISISGKYII